MRIVLHCRKQPTAPLRGRAPYLAPFSARARGAVLSWTVASLKDAIASPANGDTIRCRGHRTANARDQHATADAWGASKRFCRDPDFRPHTLRSLDAAPRLQR